jgi:hypothetical protein
MGRFDPPAAGEGFGPLAQRVDDGHDPRTRQGSKSFGVDVRDESGTDQRNTHRPPIPARSRHPKNDAR